MVSYSEAEGEYHYVLIYSGDFVFENPENITVFIPLPSGSVDDLLIEVNEEEIRPITIKLNQVIIPLDTAEGPQSLHVGYKALGTGHYSHFVPKNVFLERFNMNVSIVNVGYEEFIPMDCLSPDEFHTSGTSAYFKWNRERAILRKDISLDISTPTVVETVETVRRETPWSQVIIVGIGLVILAGISILYHAHVSFRLGRRPGFKTVYLAVPYALAFFLFGITARYFGIEFAGVSSAVIAITLSFYIQRKVLGVGKSIVFTHSVPALLLSFSTLLLLFPGLDTILFVSLPLLAAAFIYLYFVDTHRRPRYVKRKTRRIALRAQNG